MNRSIDEQDPRLVFIPMSMATVPPPGIIEHIKDKWWAVHPTKGLVFWGPKYKSKNASPSPQHNGRREIAEGWFSEVYPWARVELIPSVFRPVNPRDYE